MLVPSIDRCAAVQEHFDGVHVAEAAAWGAGATAGTQEGGESAHTDDRP